VKKILLILLPLACLICFSSTVTAQESAVYAETVSWWREVSEEMQSYRQQLQNLYADTEARAPSDCGKIESEFRKRLNREYPGSSFFATMGGTWQVNGYTLIGFDRNWKINKLTQKFGSLSKTYDFQQSSFTVTEGLNRISFKLDLNFPQRSRFDSATIPAVAVTAEQIFQKQSAHITPPGPLKDMLNDLVASNATGLRMDQLAERMLMDHAFREEMVAMADQLYSAGTLPTLARQQTSETTKPLKQLFQSQRNSSQPSFNLFSLLPWYFWPLMGGIGIALLKALPAPRRRRTWPKRPRKQDRSGDFRMGDSCEGEDWFASGSPQQPTPKTVAPPAETSVPQTWSLDVLQALEWKRFETVCAEHIRMTGYEPKETRIGADGGVDIWVYTPGREKAVGIVQCKAWKTYKVGVKPVRELLGVMAKERVAQGKFITSGEFTAEALAFVEGENLKLITGEMFLASIRKFPPEKQKELLDIAVSGDYRTPTCPQCGVKMILRQGQGQWHYPRCKATLVYKSDTV